MSELSRCGRVYHSFDDAYRAAESRTEKSGRKHVATGCAICADWHVIPAARAIGTRARYRPDPFPPAVAKLIDKRDKGECQGCGRTDVRLERHHRRGKASGGSKARAHTQCACNGLSLCRACHRWVHSEITSAREFGMVVRQSVPLPGKIGFVRYALASPDWEDDEVWARCDGEWVHSPAEIED